MERGFPFEGGTTDIGEKVNVDSEQYTTAQYYDLQGRCVDQPAKGLYIVRSTEGSQGEDGKKVIIRK